jgi:hypothetical protein
MNKVVLSTILLALVIATAVVGIATVSTSANAKKGEAALHISEQGAANQSPQGAANSGICGVCG